MKSPLAKAFVLIAVVVGIVLILSWILEPQYENNSSQQDQMQTICETSDGSWLSEHSECEYLDPAICAEIGGEFYECESACRHVESEEPVPCTMNCVPVCKL